jgi:predicted RNase H-like HicB family nuclease
MNLRRSPYDRGDSKRALGCYTSGDTFEEARNNIADTIRLHVEDRLANGEEFKDLESVNLTTVEVAV